MGKELVKRYILTRAKFYLAGGIIISIVSGIFLYNRIAKAAAGLKLTMLLELLFFIGIAVIVIGISNMINPFCAYEVKRNPHIFKQAEELIGHETYKDKFIVLSENVIGNADRRLQMAYKDQVFLLYVYTQKLNGSTHSKYLNLETATGTIQIDITFEKDNVVDELIHRICENCRYAKVGHTPENLEYLTYMREKSKKPQSL